ncbi:MAG: hypothetical protein ACFFE8_17275 [Candidatus Heimdallarchaeota archaeon]
MDLVEESREILFSGGKLGDGRLLFLPGASDQPQGSRGKKIVPQGRFSASELLLLMALSFHSTSMPSSARSSQEPLQPSLVVRG